MHFSLRTRLIILCVSIVIGAMAAVAASNFVMTRSNTMQLVSSQAQQLAHSHAGSLAQWVAAKQNVVASLLPHADAPDRVGVLKTAVKAGDFDQAYFGYPDGSFAFSENRPGRAADYDPRKRAWYRGAQSSGGRAMTEPFVGATSQKLIITFSQLIGTPGNVTAVAAGDVMLESVIQAIAAIRPTPQSYAFLVSGNGTVVAHPQQELILKPISAIHADLSLQALGNPDEARHKVWNIQGRDALLFAQPIAGSEWQLAIVMDHEEITASLQDMLTSSTLMTLVLAALAAGLLFWSISKALVRLQAVHHAIGAAGQGNFSLRLKVQGQDELSEMAHAYNRFADSITQVLQRMQDSSNSVETAASEIAAGNHDLSERTERQAENLAQTVASVDQLTHNVQLNADNAHRANSLARDAAAVAQKGGAVVHGVVDVMHEINQSSLRMAQIIGVIDSIAFQTNILALNAAVEAARAGEQGRGFAVVANEVRQLAQRSASAAREIKQLIDDSVSKVRSGDSLVKAAGSTMQDIVTSVQSVAALMHEISEASQSQSQDIAQINQVVLSMESSTQQNTALVEEAAAAASSLREQAKVLAQMVGSFELQLTPGIQASQQLLTVRSD